MRLYFGPCIWSPSILFPLPFPTSSNHCCTLCFSETNFLKLSHMNKDMQCLFVCAWLISLNVTISGSIHTAIKKKKTQFHSLWMNTIPLYISYFVCLKCTYVIDTFLTLSSLNRDLVLSQMLSLKPRTTQKCLLCSQGSDRGQGMKVVKECLWDNNREKSNKFIEIQTQNILLKYFPISYLWWT